MGDTLPPVTRWNPPGRPVGCVHLLHGMAEHRGRYHRFAGDLAAAGYVVWAHDHRGHGTNAALGKGHFGDRDGWCALMKDATRVSDRLAAEHPDAPLFLFGHSMGSVVAQTLVARQVSYAGVVLAGPSGRALATHSALLALAFVERGLRGPRQQSRWVNALLQTAFNRQFRPTRTAADWLSRDEREVDAALADPLCGIGLTTQSWIEYARGLLTVDMPGRFGHIGAPLAVLIIAGTNDPVGENGRGPTQLARAMKRNGALDVTLQLYPLARHELVHETNRNEVTRDVIEWLDAHRREATSMS